MALKPDSAKPMLPAKPVAPGFVQCADDAECRKPGRLWFQSMDPKARVCVDHATARYLTGERDDVPVKRR